MSKERPIIFSADMVNAILAGNKTQTRRVIKPQPDGTWARDENTGCHKMYPLDENMDGIPWWNIGGINGLPKCKYGKIGEKLWIRETYQSCIQCGHINYRASGQNNCAACDATFGNWNPSIYMPRSASRILLEITDIRVERLNDISVIDCCNEGAPIDDGHPQQTHAVQTWYQELWEQINGEGSWSQNPFVFVISFKRVDR